MRLTTVLLAILSLSVVSFTSLKHKSPNDADWRFLGDKNVGFGIDRDIIHFGNWGDDVRQIKLRVTDGPMKMYDMKIHFDNGTIQDVGLRYMFAQGSESRVIDLDGGLRHLSKIEFTYETRGYKKGKARVAVWGRQ
jgi:hypothetical protein